MPKNVHKLNVELLTKAFTLLVTAKCLSELYEAHKNVAGKYVHATSRGHEVIQIAVGLQLLPQDYLSAYYRDDCMLLAVGITPYELLLQLLAKKDDIFSGGRTYYAHPSLKRANMPKMPHQSSATGMQAIPATGIAMGLQYAAQMNLHNAVEQTGVALCSLGDASCTEGEVSEALQMAVLKKLPILYVVQDNEWDISAHAAEVRAQDIAYFARGFKGLEVFSADGVDFIASYDTVQKALHMVRNERRPALIHAHVPLLNHHTSGVRKEWYRDDWEAAQQKDPYPRLRTLLCETYQFSEKALCRIEETVAAGIQADFERAQAAEEPDPNDIEQHIFLPTPVTEEKGVRTPKGAPATVMVDNALSAIRELMEQHPEALLYGQDVGLRLGGVFREAATLAQQFGGHRVFNTPIQEAFIIGSTVGMSAAGLKPIVEVQFADYIWPGLNQLFTEVSRSCYLSAGKWPVSMVLRVPVGAYGGGGPYHSGSVESVVVNIKGLKVVYPSCGADLKGLLKAAYYDPNPVVIFEHKGLYWSKIKGTEAAATVAPAADYVLPIGLARVVREAVCGREKNTLTIITYGMGVYWATQAAEGYPGQIEIIDLRTLSPLDTDAVYSSVRRHHRCIVLSEEPKTHSFAQALAGNISEHCFMDLDAPVRVLGAKDLPAIPLNNILEEAMLPNAEKLRQLIQEVLDF